MDDCPYGELAIASSLTPLFSGWVYFQPRHLRDEQLSYVTGIGKCNKSRKLKTLKDPIFLSSSRQCLS
jgi:hypothetical protein